MTTPVLSPPDLPYPITIDKLIAPIGSYVEKGQRLFAYKFWYMVEIAQSPDENVDPTSSDQSSHQKKSVRESIEFFEAPFEGNVISWNLDSGDEVIKPRHVICEIKRPCNHDIVYAGICTMCGKAVDESDQVDSNLLQISHTDTNLKVSREEAMNLDKSSMTRLKNEKKLILVVDLDQTVIHCGVDPTIGEWKNDPKNPNYETLKDVKSFSLDEESIFPSPYFNEGQAPITRKCWYYVKVRPGLKDFFKKIAPLYEMHIYTMATRAYALEIAKIIDPDSSLFGNRILSRDENGSLTQKSLQRLFPTDQSMVIVIDDRGDVWNWCENLIKVVPYNFFVGIGDINSNFLPRQQSTMLQIGRRSYKKKKEANNNKVKDNDKNVSPEVKPKNDVGDNGEELLTDIMDTEKELQKKIDEEVKRQERRLSKSNVDISQNHINTKDDNNKNEITKKIEFSASLEVQQKNRPLATLQKHMQNQGLLTDDDDELYYLKDTLANIHEQFYNDLKDDKNISVQTLLPTMKETVFEDCHFVFSGLIPLGTDIRRADIVLWTNMFGATSTDLIDENTTHVITKNPGTFKARLAKSFNPKIKLVHPDWIFECLALWKHVPEAPFELLIEQPVSQEELDDFRKSLQLKKERLEEKLRMEQELQNEGALTEDKPINLFASGTSWLNGDDDEEIPFSDFDDSDDDESDTEFSLSEGKRSLEDDFSDQLNTGKKPKPEILDSDDHKNIIDEDGSSDLEEELLNALDDED